MPGSPVLAPGCPELLYVEAELLPGHDLVAVAALHQAGRLPLQHNTVNTQS